MADRRKKAAAVRYDAKKDSAPKLVAKGSGVIAEQILRIAGEHKVPLKEDRQLLEVLSTLDLYQEIPPELYKAVAEILAFVYRITKKKA
ncbi:MAG: EscU/YscU/HrcU family type III secretion system export apparatus switch protein [Thermodesulfovibrionales bacterium]